jgi:hypothetical protein
MHDMHARLKRPTFSVFSPCENPQVTTAVPHSSVLELEGGRSRVHTVVTRRHECSPRQDFGMEVAVLVAEQPMRQDNCVSFC